MRLINKAGLLAGALTTLLILASCSDSNTSTGVTTGKQLANDSSTQTVMHQATAGEGEHSNPDTNHGHSPEQQHGDNQIVSTSLPVTNNTPSTTPATPTTTTTPTTATTPSTATTPTSTSGGGRQAANDPAPDSDSTTPAATPEATTQVATTPAATTTVIITNTDPIKDSIANGSNNNSAQGSDYLVEQVAMKPSTVGAIDYGSTGVDTLKTIPIGGKTIGEDGKTHCKTLRMTWTAGKGCDCSRTSKSIDSRKRKLYFQVCHGKGEPIQYLATTPAATNTGIIINPDPIESPIANGSNDNSAEGSDNLVSVAPLSSDLGLDEASINTGKHCLVGICTDYEPPSRSNETGTRNCTDEAKLVSNECKDLHNFISKQVCRFKGGGTGCSKAKKKYCSALSAATKETCKSEVAQAKLKPSTLVDTSTSNMAILGNISGFIAEDQTSEAVEYDIAEDGGGDEGEQ